MYLVTGILFQVSVGGFMHFWGLTIDSVACIALQLATGLCVDYAAHICLAFLSQTGSRSVRALEAVTKIGPAVYNGGISSLIGITMLAFSESHIFNSFFKVKYMIM
jgi:predicted RND superfamily exporter protein